MGLLLGLHEAGIDVADTDLIVGTSAGAVVGAQITSGLSPEDLYAFQLQPLEQTKEQVVPFERATLFQAFAAGAGAADVQTARARIGAAALAVKTISEEARLETIAARLPVQHWPNTPRLVIVAVDAQTGEWVIFDQDSAVPLVLAVAASCAFPGISPPTTIDGHRYIDGGVRSGTNADLAKGSKVALIVRTGTLDLSAVEESGHIPRMTFEDEQEELQQAGTQVLVIVPDEASVAARGPNPFDSSRRALSAKAGRAQGHLLAERVKRFWGN
jgi:NTE family protein